MRQRQSALDGRLFCVGSFAVGLGIRLMVMGVGTRDDGHMLGTGAIASSVVVRDPRVRLRALSLPLAIVAIAALMAPLFLAGPSHLTSDESLYLAEAYNIAEGRGFTYPSGEAIIHRAPLYPALLAPAVAFAGADAAYGVTKLVVAINAVLVIALAWRLGGQVAGWVAGLAAAASAYLSELGTTLYLDPMQCLFLLLSLLALHVGVEKRQLRWWALAGLSAGLAFLVKESAIEWAPLAIVTALALPSQRNRLGARGALVFTAVFIATILPWWVWVYAHTGDLFLLGEPQRVAIEAVVAVAILAGAALVFRRSELPASWAMPAAIVIVATWGAFFLYGLTAFSGYPAPNEYQTSIPRYLLQVAPQMQPYFPIVAAWGWVSWRAVQGDERARLLVVAAALFAPFALFAANRWLQLRDALPLVYLSYVALGVAAADLWTNVRSKVEGTGALPVALGAAAIAAVAFVAHEAVVFDRTTEREALAREEAGSWDSPYTREVAAWMSANIPAGSQVMTSRQYFSSLHVETEGRFEIRQLPTVRVAFDPSSDELVQARDNLFRWEDSELRETQPSDTWLHLQQFPNKGYWVGLSEQELLAFIDANDIQYIALTGDDIAFSSSAYAWYFTANPAFEMLGTVKGTGGDRMFAYSVGRASLAPIPHSTSIHPRSATELQSLLNFDLSEISDALGTPLRVTDADGVLSERELEAALAGMDLGAKGEAAR